MRDDISCPVNNENFRLGNHSEMSERLNSSRSASAQNLVHDTNTPPAATLPAPPAEAPAEAASWAVDPDEEAGEDEDPGAESEEEEEEEEAEAGEADDTGRGSSKSVFAFCNSL